MSPYDAVETSQRGGAPVELYRFTVGVGTFYGFTSSDQPVIFNGDTYTPEVLSRGEIAHSQEADSGKIEVELPRTNPVVQPFIPYQPEPPMLLQVWRKHRSDPEGRRIFTGTVASVRFTGSRATLTCLPITSLLRRQIPRNTYQSQCNWALYGNGCGVSKNLFQIIAVVTAQAGDTITATNFSSQPDGWLNNGWVERATGERRFVVNHVGALVTLMNPFVGMAIGESVFAYAGCDRTEAVCLTKFNNIVNHLGFPRVPTRNPFDGGLA